MQVRPSGNQKDMRSRGAGWGLFCLVVVSGSLCAFGWAPGSVPGPSAARQTPREELAQILIPFSHETVVPIDVRKAFLEGYQAYKNHDLVAAVERMELASKSLPELADYALFYLGSAQRDNGRTENAADAFQRLTALYPQSVWADIAGVEYARLELTLGHPEIANVVASKVALHTSSGGIEQNARLVAANARLKLQDFRGAYSEAQSIREKFPAGAADRAARSLAHAILAGHPQVAPSTSLEYRRTEAALLLSEGEPAMALAQIRAALAVGPPRAIHAELLLLEAEASRGNPDAAKSALLSYLALAPDGEHAPGALNALAHIYWHVDNTARAREYFERIARDFPSSAQAPSALFEIGRTYEDDADLKAARTEYQRLAKRYPSSETAAEAHFRAPFMLYMMKQYAAAAAEFGEMKAQAQEGAERDMFTYWQARALESNGEAVQARELFKSVALSTVSNYYPTLASLKVNLVPDSFPAANAADPVAAGEPTVEGSGQFHLTRALALRELGLRELEPAELRELAQDADRNPSLRDFVLVEFQASGAWYDAIVMATRMAKRGELGTFVAERIRYPRAYWDLIAATSSRDSLDPYLVLALIHQESLFNPEARSGSDARGLMQLLPSTAGRFALTAGATGSPLNLYDPALSVEVGTTYLRSLLEMFGGDIFKAVAAYNAGEKAVSGWNAKYPGDDDQWVENIAYHETRDYVKKVIGGLREYRLIYQPHYAGSVSGATLRSPG